MLLITFNKKRSQTQDHNTWRHRKTILKHSHHGFLNKSSIPAKINERYKNCKKYNLWPYGDILWHNQKSKHVRARACVYLPQVFVSQHYIFLYIRAHKLFRETNCVSAQLSNATYFLNKSIDAKAAALIMNLIWLSARAADVTSEASELAHTPNVSCEPSRCRPTHVYLFISKLGTCEREDAHHTKHLVSFLFVVLLKNSKESKVELQSTRVHGRNSSLEQFWRRHSNCIFLIESLLCKKSTVFEIRAYIS